MIRTPRTFVPAIGALTLLMTASLAAAQDADLAKKVDQLSKQVEELRGRISSPEAKAGKPDWITFGGDLRVSHHMLRGKIPTYQQFLGTFTGPVPNSATVPAKTVKNDSLLTNRLGFDIHVKPAESVTLTARLLSYKTFGMADSGATQAGFFGDRQSTVFDGTQGHVPASNALLVDRAYGTVNDLFGQPAWFSAGRRPSTGGVPTNIRDNREVSGSGGTPGIMIDYAFDGATAGVAPDLEKLPGFAAKLCYGRGYDSGYLQGGVTPKDTNFMGVNAVLYETADSRLEGEYLRAFDIFDAIPGPGVKTNLGDIEEYGGNLVRTFRDLGPGDLTTFLSGATSLSHPNNNRYDAGFGSGNPGLMCSGVDCVQSAGYAYYLGARYDLKKTLTKVGAEFNRGSKNWITFGPAGDDIWTSKLGTRGNVYELYAIQELPRAPIARNGKVFFRLGWQYYDFQYTGSNSWVGAPQVIKNLTLADMQFMAPIRSAYDIYTTFEIRF